MTKKNHRGLACAAVGFGLLLAAGAHGQGTTGTAATGTADSGTATAPQLNDTDRLFMLRSAQGDMAEIQTSQMALKKAKSGDVKQVAQRLVTEHGQSLQEGMGLGVLLGLTPPKDPGFSNMAVAMKLQGADGKDFDKQYMAAQVENHENTVALYNMELSQGQNVQVKAFASKYLPGVEAHTAQIYRVSQTVGAPGIALRPSTPPMVNGVPAADMPGMSGGAGGTMPAMTPATGATGGAMPSGNNTGGATAPGGTTGTTGTATP